MPLFKKLCTCLAGALILPAYLAFSQEQDRAVETLKDAASKNMHSSSYTSNKAVAIVNNIPISRIEFNTLVEARKTYLMGQPGVLENGIDNLPSEIKQKLLDDLVLTELLAQEANKRGVDKLLSAGGRSCNSI